MKKIQALDTDSINRFYHIKKSQKELYEKAMQCAKTDLVFLSSAFVDIYGGALLL